MAVDASGARGVPLEAQLRWRLRLTASPAASPPRQGPTARPGRGRASSGTGAGGGWQRGWRPPSPGRAGPTKPFGAWRPAPDPARPSRGRGPGGFRARGRGPLGLPAARPRGARRSPAAAQAGPPARRLSALNPLGATIESPRPLSPSKATLAPTPPAEHRTRPLVAGRPGEPAPAAAPAPAPRPWRNGGGGGIFPEGAVERHTGR